MKYLVACLLCAVAVAWAAPTALGAGCVEDGEPAIAIAPSTLLIGVEQGGAVTVHTNIPFRAVDASSLALNGIAARAVFADNQGDLVAKFSEAAIEAMAAPGTMTLTLTGSYADGEAFEASNTVTVKVAPQPGR